MREKFKLAALLAAVICIFAMTACESTYTLLDSEASDYYNNEENTDNGGAGKITDSDSTCNIYFLDVGQGCSTLVECDGEYMIIDGGNSDKSSFVVSYSKNMNIAKFEYVIATHYDSDHISGLVGIMNVFDVENVFAPDYETDTKFIIRL